MNAAPPAWPALARPELHDELHARPPLQVGSGGVVSYWVQHGMTAVHAHAILAEWCAALGAAAPDADTRYCSAPLCSVLIPL